MFYYKNSLTIFIIIIIRDSTLVLFDYVYEQIVIPININIPVYNFFYILKTLFSLESLNFKINKQVIMMKILEKLQILFKLYSSCSSFYNYVITGLKKPILSQIFLDVSG